MRISEIFYSIQGEGIYQGLPMVFLRTQGCNLAEEHGGCRWCDTGYAQTTALGEEWSIEAIISQLAQYPNKRVCITGGEPLYQLEIGELIYPLKTEGYWLEVETNGSIPIGEYLECVDSWVVDVKCPSSGMESYNRFENLQILRECDQVKFVLADRADVEYAELILRSHPTRAHLLFSPAYGDMGWLQEVAEYVKGIPQVRLSVQIHKFVWGEDRREGSDFVVRRSGLGHCSSSR